MNLSTEPPSRGEAAQNGTPVSLFRTRLAWSLAIGSVAMTVLSAAAAFAFGWDTGDPLLVVTLILASMAWGAIGALIASKTGNAVGWALLAVIGAVSLSLSTQTYATVSLYTLDGRLPFAVAAAWISTMTFIPSLALIVAIPLLYPTGTPRWRWVWRLYVAALAVLAVSWALLPQELGLAVGPGLVSQPANPLGIDSWERRLGTLAGAAAFTILACAAASILALVLRYRGSHGDERQQVRWLAYVGVAAAVAFLSLLAVVSFVGDPPRPGWPTVLSNAVFQTFVWIVVLGIPAACGVAILKYRLYDLDVVIRKTLVVTLVVISLLALYVGVLALAAVGSAPPVIVGLILLVVTFRPVVRAARTVADRVAYGRRASAYEVLTEFSGRVGEAYATDDVLPRMARLLAEGTGADTARVFLQLGSDLRAVATWPSDGEPGADEQLVPVVHQGAELGALGVSMPPNDPWDAPRARLTQDLASQAGLVLRNVRLIEELRASRQRLVAAQDEERRRIERNLHDGIQQQLVALNVQLGLLAKFAEREPAKAAEMAGQLQTRATEALDDLRDLARGIYPPLLADQGLVAALQAQARKAAVPTAVEAEGIGRYDQAIESAVYFCVLEALNNAAKYASASGAVVELTGVDGRLAFTITDDGAGFDPETHSYGTGMQGMSDRLDAIGGELSVTSRPGSGTTIAGSIPVEHAR
jgi:signal transduction histidine kinase